MAEDKKIILEQSVAKGCLYEFAWLGAGFVMPLFSFSFYREASRRKTGGAILFFITFTLILSILTTVGIFSGLWPIANNIREAFVSGRVPEITIRDGVAEVEGNRPYVFVNEPQGIFAAVDATGQIRRIDQTRYVEGLLLTKTELHMLTKRGQYQILPLNSLHNFFKVNPIFINGETTSRAWRTISIIYSLLALIGLVIWHTILRLMVILLIALVLWGIVSLIRPRTGFGPILIAGIYSLVPAIYLHFLFGLLHFSFPFLQTILLTVFWAIALVITFVEIEFLKEQKQLRIWRAALGIPMLLAFAVEAIIKLQPGVAVCWIIFLFTIFILGAISLYLRIRNINVEQTTTKLL